jgi:hypothetical protein
VKTAVILASGHSLTLEQIEAARLSGHFTIAVNTTYEKALWAHAMYAGDFMWFKLNIAKLRASKFKGKLVTQDSSAAAHYQLTRVRGTNRGGLGKEVIHMNGNSGVQAINLAFLWGYRRIILLGFDMKLGPKGEKHHHADHGHPAVQHQCFDEWLKKIQLVATDLVAAKCEVIDCTVGGALRCFPKGDWKEVLK